jgi:hypothetical protein
MTENVYCQSKYCDDPDEPLRPDDYVAHLRTYDKGTVMVCAGCEDAYRDARSDADANRGDAAGTGWDYPDWTFGWYAYDDTAID